MTIIVIICVVTLTNAFNHEAPNKRVSPPYWKQDHFEEKDLPTELRGKSIQYIDSAFKSHRYAEQKRQTNNQ